MIIVPSMSYFMEEEEEDRLLLPHQPWQWSRQHPKGLSLLVEEVNSPKRQGKEGQEQQQSEDAQALVFPISASGDLNISSSVPLVFPCDAGLSIPSLAISMTDSLAGAISIRIIIVFTHLLRLPSSGQQRADTSILRQLSLFTSQYRYSSSAYNQ
jgi:hypothetical protein